MSDKMDYINIFTDLISEGFIFIDRTGEIKIYNRSAKEIFGIETDNKIHHKAGRIKPGDIVIIANTALGKDDGNMDGESLKLIGLNKMGLEEGDPFISISRHPGENLGNIVSKPGEDFLKLEKTLAGNKIRAEIDFLNNEIEIKVNKESYNLSYINYIGHMVILDGDSMELKFYQSLGYTARKESINDILQGAYFLEKGRGIGARTVIGENIFTINQSESLINNFYKVAQGENINWIEKYEEINGFPTLSSLHPIDKNGDRLGAVLRVENISEIEKIVKERDNILEELKQSSKERKEREVLQLAFPDYIGEDEKIINVKRLAYRASKTLSNVLIIGSPGVGKTLLARSIHENTNFLNGEFIHINSKSISKIEIEEYINRMREGSIYIEEIGDLDYSLQVFLLERLKQKTRVEPRSRIRLVASTSKNLDQKVIEGSFNEELYYNINVFPIVIPDLIKRGNDLYLLINYAIPRICKRIDVREKRLSTEALELLLKYNWPGNIRELFNVLERSINLTLGDNILTKHIVLLDNVQNYPGEEKTLKELLEEKEKAIIQAKMAEYKDDRKKVISSLGISQSTFYEKLKKYDLN